MMETQQVETGAKEIALKLKQGSNVSHRALPAQQSVETHFLSKTKSATMEELKMAMDAHLTA